MPTAQAPLSASVSLCLLLMVCRQKYGSFSFVAFSLNSGTGLFHIIVVFRSCFTGMIVHEVNESFSPYPDHVPGHL